MPTILIPGPKGHARPHAKEHAPDRVGVFDGALPLKVSDLPASWLPLVDSAEQLRAACYGPNPPEPLRVLVDGQAGGMEHSLKALELYVEDDMVGTRHGKSVSLSDVLAAID